eukprot:656149-Prorocentrum_lima.AAC.1
MYKLYMSQHVFARTQAPALSDLTAATSWQCTPCGSDFRSVRHRMSDLTGPRLGVPCPASTTKCLS